MKPTRMSIPATSWETQVPHGRCLDEMAQKSRSENYILQLAESCERDTYTYISIYIYVYVYVKEPWSKLFVESLVAL